MSDAIDPELAALLGGEAEPLQGKGGSAPRQGPGSAGPDLSSTPDFEALFGGLNTDGESKTRSESSIDLSRTTFAPVTKYEEEKAADFFADADYYKRALANEGDEAQRVHEILSKYLKASDPKDRGVFRQQIISSYWYLATNVAIHSVQPSVHISKKLMLRYGVLLPSLITPEQRDTLAKIIYNKDSDEPIYYVDEWIKGVANGQIKASATDEVKSARGDDRAKVNASLQKAQGRKDAVEGTLKAKAEERRSLESDLGARVDEVRNRTSQPGLLNIPAPYTDGQRKAASEVMEILRKLSATDKALALNIEEYEKASEALQDVEARAKDFGGDTKADLQTVAQEFEAIKQMVKLCIGRQGNQFPILTKDHFHGSNRDIATRENVIKNLAWIESIDSQAFMRPYKNVLNRIVPFIILVPAFGDQGICWEPFDKFNRATGRGRISIPLYPKNVQAAVIYAVADLRWQVAKEKASYYWMEEGLTGSYYQWFTSKKLKGDVKEAFIQDYIIWVTKESEGMQKLDKEVRAEFWRLMPFQQAIKDKLKTRSYIYQELCQKDNNRSRSDGY
ncbi:MAG: hypothetical protein WCQ50_01480 [Spirochaetota bacterium]